MTRKPAKKTSRATPRRANADTANTPAGSTAQRFVVSNLLSMHAAGQARVDAIEQFSAKLESVLLGSVDVRSDSTSAMRTKMTGERRIVVIEGDAAEIAAMSKDLTGDTVIEPELPRVPAIAYPNALLPNAAAGVTGPGSGSLLGLHIVGVNAEPVAGATVIVRFNRLGNAGESVVAGGISNNSGDVAIAFDSNQWRPGLAVVEPAGRYWTCVKSAPQSGQSIQLEALPTDGPFGWWQLLSGLPEYDLERGKGIRIGVIDTGVGPHPYLAHAVPVGAFLNGAFVPGVKEGRDVQVHGTHVSGIIGARPDGTAFGGIAAGADLYVARVFAANSSGNQGDVANAIDRLSVDHSVDVINMSLTGAASAIEHDAVIVAYQRGTLCVCAAGNQSGSAVGFPAAYPECIAVSALGLLGVAPNGSMPALNIPTQYDRFGSGGMFLASFSNVGPQILCAAPGNGIISTIPTTRHEGAPYADMSGTSMSAPIVTATLACLLAADPHYAALERTTARSLAARHLLARHAASIGLNASFQGAGLARAI